MRIPRILAGALALGLAVGLAPVGAASAASAAGPGDLSDAALLGLHAALGCEMRLMYPGTFTKCGGAEWDEYLDVQNEMKRRNLPLRVQPPIAATYDVFMDPQHPEDFDYFAEEFSEYDWAYEDGMMDDDEWLEREAKKAKKPTNPFKPSTSKPREFMINTLGSVLGESMPDKWRAEQLANQHRYNHSWEGLRAQFGQDPANPNYMGQPDSYDDYVLKRTELEEHGGTNGRKNTAPATKTSTFRKGVAGVGGGLAAIMGLPFAFSIGNGVTNLVGIDSQGAVCSSVGDDAVGDLVALITGNDCSAFWDFVPSYDPNTDAVPGVSWGSLCASNGFCYEYVGTFIYVDKGATRWTTYQTTCFTGTGTKPSPVVEQFFVEWGPAPAGIPNNTYIQGYLPGQVTSENARPPADFGARAAACAAAGGGYAFSVGVGTNGVAGTEWPARGLPVAMGWGATAATADMEAPIIESGDPDRALVCTIEGSDGHTYTQTTAATYNEGSGGMIAPECPSLPDGVRPNSVGVSDSLGNELMDEDVTDAYAHWWDEYPECREGACKLDLVQLGGSYPVSCFDLENTCADWFSDPDKVDKYECHYGIHTVELAECNVYSGVFQKGRIAIGAPYSDPTTGEWSGGQSSPAEAAEQMNAGVQDPDAYRTCLESGWAEFNPVEWIFTPMRCALEWAFVPRPAVVNLEGYQMTRAWEESPPGVIIGELSGWDFSIDASGCEGFTIELPFLGEQTYFYACDGAGAQLAAMVKPITTLGIIIPGAIGIISMVGGVIGYHRGGGA